MKYFLNAFLFIAFSYFYGCSSCYFSESEAVNLINPESIKKHVVFLASDSLKGRQTPGKELDSAASYIAREFSLYGLSPVNGAFLQRINFGKTALGNDNHLKISRKNRETSLQIKTEYVPFEMTANRQVNAPLVFAGYGITAPEYNYDDYKEIDVKGKIVLVLRHEPQENDTASIFKGSAPTDYSQVDTKIKIAREHGAVGVIIVTDPVNHLSLTPQGFPWPSLSKFIPKDALPVTVIEAEEEKVPVVHAGKELINEVFGSVDSLISIQRKIDSNNSSFSFEIPGCSVSIKTSTEIDLQPSYNVVGFLEGSDPEQKNELVVVGAHYDHAGYKKQHIPETDYIFNGADDNASGTSGVLVLAKAFASLSEKPKRSILFITFTGEEIGLLGSKYYADNPLFPLSKTVAMLNMDMIGRNNPDTLFIIGASRCPDLAEINKLENEKTGFILDYSQEKYLPYSDQASFLKKNVPVIFFNTGEHKDYHKVTDEAPLLDYLKASKVAKLAFFTVARIANDNRRYKSLSNQISFF